MHRTVGAALLVSLVVLAGCAGFNGAGEAGTDATNPSPERPTADPDTPTPTGSPAGQDSPATAGTTATAAGPAGELTLHHIDVGIADATLIVTPAGETVLIDTGDDEDAGEPVIAYLAANGIDRIDHLVATHPHPEHIGGHAAVIEWAETNGAGVGTAYGAGLAGDSAAYDGYLDAIERYDVEHVTVASGDELPIEDEAVSALVLNPPRDDAGEDLHYNSVSLAVEFGEFRYVTTGDAEADAEARMVDEWAGALDADVYHAGHHGGVSSSTQPFMDAVSPAIAVVSSNTGPPREYPHDEVLERFATMGIETYWTGVHGHVVVTTDGAAVTVETSREFSSDPAELLAAKANGTADGTSNRVVTGSARSP